MRLTKKFVLWAKDVIKDTSVQVATVITIAILTFVYGNSYLREFLTKFLQAYIPISWVIAVVIVILLAVGAIALFLRSKRKPVLLSGFRFRNNDETEIPFEHSGLRWIAYIPNQTMSSSWDNPDEYVWLTGPFCPKCTIQLKWSGGIFKRWACRGCSTKFKPTVSDELECKNLVEEYCYARFFRNKKFGSPD